VFCLRFRTQKMKIYELFGCNRKFTFYPLLFHKRGVDYYQSKDIDRQTPNITSHPIPIKSAYDFVGAFDFWLAALI